MKMQKKLSGNWAKKGEDIKNGDAVEILDGGQEDMGEYGKRIVFKIKTRNGEKSVAFNQTSINTLIDEFGDDSDKWVGNSVKIDVVKALVAGKMQNIFYFTPVGWEMADDGTWFNSGANRPVTGQIEPNNDDINVDELV